MLKSARCCGPKHIWKSKCTKHLSVGPLLEVEMSKKCTPLWRKTHFQVNSVKLRKSLSGIPNSRKVLFLQFFCEAKRWNPLRKPLNLTWLRTKASWNLLQNLLRNPVEPDLALHQSLPDLLRAPSLEPC